MKQHYEYRIAQHVEHTAPYGFDVTDQEMPVMSYLGLVAANRQLVPAYSLLRDDVAAYAVGLNVLHGNTPYDAVTLAGFLEARELNPTARNHLAAQLAARMGWKIPPCGPDDANAHLVAVVNKYTQQLAFYFFYVAGDGVTVMFTTE